MSVSELYPVERVRHMPFFYYPAVNTDTDALTADKQAGFRRDLNQPKAGGRKAILYLHVPFCRTHCSYCFYNIKVLKKTDPAVSAYLDALVRQMAFYAATPYVQNLSIEHIFIGGGTPSMLSDEHLRQVLTALRELFDLRNVQDMSIEMNVETMTASNLEVCRELGVSRISFGWQTSVPRLRKMLALVASERRLANNIGDLQRLGYSLIWDLLYAVPTQTMEEWDADLQRSIDLGVACIDIHRCDIVPPAPLYELVREGRYERVTQQAALDQYLHAYRTLTAAGYVVNTFQQFNRPDRPDAVSHYGRYYYRSSHDILAFGPGGIGVVADWAYMNARDIDEFVRRSTGDDPVLGCACPVTPATWQERDFVLGMGQLWSVPKALLTGPLTAQQGAALEKLIRHGAMVETEHEYRLTEDAVGYHFSIANEFVTPEQTARNVGYLRSISKEIVWRAGSRTEMPPPTADVGEVTDTRSAPAAT
ncbi:MAG: radical SAM protein [Deltaproteobacteria bacterium]|nr:radical SAM protein [Deltaproteobacteria bacterium]